MRILIAAVLAGATAQTMAAAAAPRIGAGCRIDIGPLDFGVYNARQPTPDNAIGRLAVDCLSTARATPARLLLTSGFGGQFQDRTLTMGTHQLHYNLYAEPSHQRILGDGSGGTVTFPVARTRGLRRIIFPIFGSIPPQQAVPAGEYTDLLLVEVEF